MNLPIPFFSKQDKKEYLLALLLRAEHVTAIIIEQTKNQSRIIGRYKAASQAPIEKLTDELFLSILDAAISKAESTIPPDVEAQKTIFGVPSEWVEEKHIKKEYLAKLKKASESLSLTPIGFLEIPEAIIFLMQEEEGAPVSAVLAELGKTLISVSLVRAGIIIDTKQATFVSDIPAAVDTLLKSFSGFDVFPSRMIIFDGETKPEQLTQAFVAHQWSKSLPFLHVPQISILPGDFDEKAVVFGAAKQLGFEPSEIAELKGNVVPEVSQNESSFIKHHEQNPKQEEKTQVPIASQSLEEFGFVKNIDIAEKKTEKPISQIKETRKETTQETKRDEEEVENEKEQFQQKAFEESTEPTFSDNFSQQSTYIERSDKQKDNLTEGMKLPATLISLFTVVKTKALRSRLSLIVPFFLILCVGLLLIYINLLRANITIFVSPKEASEQTTITFTTEGDSDFADNIISAKTTSQALSGSVTTEVTGKKDIGTKAKGTVTIFNSSESKKQLSAGSEITSSNNLIYILDKDLTVSSASGDIFTGIKSGTSQVSVTAKQIGSEYNVPSNTKFSVSSNSTLAAKNDQAFSGGSKKSVAVVDSDDIDKLTADLPKSLLNKAKDQLAKKISSSQSLLTVTYDFKPSKKDFSQNVGDEARSVRLSSSVTFEAVSYEHEELLLFTKELLKSKFDQSLSAADSDIQNTLKSVKQENDTEITADLLTKAKLFPTLQKDKLVKSLSGKSFDEAKEILEEYPQVSEVEISLFPPLPLVPQVLPRNSENIEIVLEND